MLREQKLRVWAAQLIDGLTCCEQPSHHTERKFIGLVRHYEHPTYPICGANATEKKCMGIYIYIWKWLNWLCFKVHNTPISFSWGSFWNIEMFDIVDAAEHNLLRKWSASFALACNREWRSTALCRCQHVLSVLNSESAFCFFPHQRVSLREFKFVLIKTDEVSKTNKKHIVFCSCKILVSNPCGRFIRPAHPNTLGFSTKRYPSWVSRPVLARCHGTSSTWRAATN